jgi:hypothetical protein
LNDSIVIHKKRALSAKIRDKIFQLNQIIMSVVLGVAVLIAAILAPVFFAPKSEAKA